MTDHDDCAETCDVKRAIGLMSGTSMDGVDVALIDTDGERAVRFGPQASYPYTDAERVVLRSALAVATGLTDRDARPRDLAVAEELVTRRHAEAVEVFLSEHAIARQSVDVVGFHGQTVLHRPERRLTVQIGDAVGLADRLDLPVASDFRAADVAAGGQGAPLVPIYHRALVERDGLADPVVVVNIGGVANFTYIAFDADLIACDCGPGNALLDDLMLASLGMACDTDGAMAAKGKVDATALARLLAHPFFARPAPKSLDRNAFSREPVDKLSLEDAAATLTAFTAAGIASSFASLPSAPTLAVVCGGGARNPTLVGELQNRLPCQVVDADTLGWSIEAMEAQAFAYLAVRCLNDLPITFPSTTGVAAPLGGGRLAMPRSRRRLAS